MHFEHTSDNIKIPSTWLIDIKFMSKYLRFVLNLNFFAILDFINSSLCCTHNEESFTQDLNEANFLFASVCFCCVEIHIRLQEEVI